MSESGNYEWDAVKAESNLESHGVSFEEAASVLESESAQEWNDVANPGRTNTVGFSVQGRALFVVTTEVTETGRTRIISARKATKADLRRFFP